jgi:hypothetical protein
MGVVVDEAKLVTEHGPIVSGNFADMSPQIRIAARAKGLDPGRRVD